VPVKPLLPFFSVFSAVVVGVSSFSTKKTFTTKINSAEIKTTEKRIKSVRKKHPTPLLLFLPVVFFVEIEAAGAFLPWFGFGPPLIIFRPSLVNFGSSGLGCEGGFGGSFFTGVPHAEQNFSFCSSIFPHFGQLV
jgi:hypothetical protein